MEIETKFHTFRQTSRASTTMLEIQLVRLSKRLDGGKVSLGHLGAAACASACWNRGYEANPEGNLCAEGWRPADENDLKQAYWIPNS